MITVQEIRFNGDNKLHYIVYDYKSAYKYMVTDDGSLHLYDVSNELIASYAKDQWANVKKVVEELT